MQIEPDKYERYEVLDRINEQLQVAYNMANEDENAFCASIKAVDEEIRRTDYYKNAVGFIPLWKELLSLLLKGIAILVFLISIVSMLVGIYKIFDNISVALLCGIIVAVSVPTSATLWTLGAYYNDRCNPQFGIDD